MWDQLKRESLAPVSYRSDTLLSISLQRTSATELYKRHWEGTPGNKKVPRLTQDLYFLLLVLINVISFYSKKSIPLLRKKQCKRRRPPCFIVYLKCTSQFPLWMRGPFIYLRKRGLTSSCNGLVVSLSHSFRSYQCSVF